jgi:hypothetical protein
LSRISSSTSGASAGRSEKPVIANIAIPTTPTIS